MARVTVEDCLNHVENRFGLVHLAVQRVKQLRKGGRPFVYCDNREVVTALREIGDGLVLPGGAGNELPLEMVADPSPIDAPAPAAESAGE